MFNYNRSPTSSRHRVLSTVQLSILFKYQQVPVALLIIYLLTMYLLANLLIYLLAYLLINYLVLI